MEEIPFEDEEITVEDEEMPYENEEISFEDDLDGDIKKGQLAKKCQHLVWPQVNS